MSIPKRNLSCAYCGRSLATEWDHVIARQFFPAEGSYRGKLPKVPACRGCNSAKQKVEDGPAVLFQFGHISEASQPILNGRARRTLRKNRRLHHALRHGLEEVLVRKPSGLLVPSLAIKLSPRDLSEMWAWFRYVAKGLYYYESTNILPSEHTLHLVIPQSLKQFMALRNLIACDKAQQRELASGEIHYIFSRDDHQEITGWLMAFKSIDMAWFTIGPQGAAYRDDFARIEWRAPLVPGN